MIRTIAATAILTLTTSVLPVTGVSAAGVSETLAVSVTVVRSCFVEAQALDRRSSSVRLGCSVGQHSRVLVGNGVTGGQLASLGALMRVDAPPDSSASVSTRTVTLNF
jgi:hypothetical protein